MTWLSIYVSDGPACGRENGEKNKTSTSTIWTSRLASEILRATSDLAMH
jgi:hypothetical protein